MHYPARGRQPRAPHPVHQLPGRMRGRLSVLRHRRAGHGARPRDRGDRRPGAQRGSTPRGRGHAAHERRVHGHGRAVAQPRPRARVDLRAQRPDPVRARRAAHHGEHVGRRARDPPADRARAAVHARGLAPRRAQRPARRPRAAQPSLAGRGGRRGGPRARADDRPPGDLRGHDDRRDQRHGRRCRRDGGAAARRARARQPDPDERRRAHAVDGHADRALRAVRRAAPRRRASRPRSASTAGPRSGRPAASSPPSTPASRRRSSSSAAASGSSTESAKALRGERSDDPVPAGVGEG